MVFLFQMQTVAKKQAQEVAAFKAAETYSLNMFRAINGVDGVTAVDSKTAKYIEYAAKEKGHPFSSELKAKIPGNVLNDISRQSTINRLVKEYNTPPKGEIMPEYEKLPSLSSKEVVDAIKIMLPTMKISK